MSVRNYASNYPDGKVTSVAETPGHWRLLQLKYCLVKNDGGVWGDDPSGDDTDVIVLRSTEQTVDGHWNITEPAKRKLTESELRSAILRQCDLLVTKSSGSDLHIGKTTLVDSAVENLNCCYSNFMQRLRCNHQLNPRLAWYFLNSSLARNQFGFFSNTTTGLANLNASVIGKIVIPLGNLSEQNAIVAFLDAETSKIDALVAEQRRLIELLKEKRQAVISHAVTKGLNPHVKMKPSGIDWLGDVPEHWNVTRFGWTCNYISYGFTNPMPTTDDGPIMLTANDVEYGKVNYETARRTSEADFANLLTDKCRPIKDDILLTKDGTLGRVAVHDGRKACINQSVALLRLDMDMAVPSYVCLALQSGLYQERMSYDAGGTTIKHIYISRLAKMPFTIPPKLEQHEIVKALELRLSYFDKLVSSAEATITLLQERRTALISAAVTGKIDVRDFVPKDVFA